MRSTGKLLLLCAAVVLCAPAAAAQSTNNARTNLLVSPAWLADHLRDQDLVLLHVGPKPEYDAAHITGARLVTLDAISTSDHSGGGLMLEMPTNDTLRARLAALGISDKSRVVVYYGKDWVTPTTRVIHTLEYAGLGANVSLLDGGMGGWTKAGHAVTDVVPAPRQGTLAALKTRPVIVDAEYVKAHLGKPGFSVIDGRSSSFYDGVQTGGMQGMPHRTGHIAGALSVPFTEITNVDLQLKSPAELEAVFAKAGVKPGDTIIGYCHIGQQATGMLFAARTLGHPVVLYDGSFEDWSKHTDYPVDNPSAKGKP